MSWPSDKEFYYELRSCHPTLLNKYTRAARFIYLNRYCFNGVYRTNRNGQFNVARGQHMGSIPSASELRAFGRLMRAVDVLKCDFASLLEQAGEGDFVYLDPPYAGRDVRDRGEYGVGAFKVHDLERFVDAVQAASDRGAKILISYADLPQVRDLFHGWHLTRLSVARNVAGFAGARSSVSELILRNYS